MEFLRLCVLLMYNICFEFFLVDKEGVIVVDIFIGFMGKWN